MDTDTDFIRPEFLNILFFQQKNLIIFPYVDIKHLRSLELFTVGHNPIDLEATVVFNIMKFLKYEQENSYSQSRSFYFITNVDKDKIKEIMQMDNVRCVVNTKEQDISNLANGSKFIFYNKKKKKFLNYDDSTDLEVEKLLISEYSESEEILKDKIQQIKTTASIVYAKICKNDYNLGNVLKDYSEKHCEKILKFVSAYYDIRVPDISKINLNAQLSLNDFSNEYDLIISSNKNIAKEFIQLLHEYRSQNVNSSNLKVEQMYDPNKLYNYLRNHHWDNGISEDFIQEWILMENIKYKLKPEDVHDFESLLSKLNISIPEVYEKLIQLAYKEKTPFEFELSSPNPLESNNINKYFDKSKNYKESILKKLQNIDDLIDKL